MIQKKSFPLAKVYQLLEPGPVVMVTTSYKNKHNIMTMTWHMMIDFEPPIFACIMGEENYSFNMLKKTKECVFNIPAAHFAPIVVGVGDTTGAKIDKFAHFNLTAQEASQVNAPLIGECFANLECIVIDSSRAQRYNLFVLEVVKAWHTPHKTRQRMLHHCGNGVFVVDGKVIKLPFHKK